MLLNLNKPLVFFDLETTGVNVGMDHIVEICLYKVNPDQIRGLGVGCGQERGNNAYTGSYNGYTRDK